MYEIKTPLWLVFSLEAENMKCDAYTINSESGNNSSQKSASKLSHWLNTGSINYIAATISHTGSRLIQLTYCIAPMIQLRALYYSKIYLKL